MHSISRFLAFFLLILCCFMTEQRALAADATAPQEPVAATEKTKQDNAAPASGSPARSADATPAAQPEPPVAVRVSPEAAPQAESGAATSASQPEKAEKPEKKEPSRPKVEKKPVSKPKTDKKENAAPKADKGEVRPAGADKKEAPGDEEAAEPEEEKSGVLHDPWSMVWSNQHNMLDEVNAKALDMSDTFGDRAFNVSEKVQPFIEEARRLLVLSNTYKSWPNAMEAVSRRLTVTIAEVNKILAPLMAARGESQALLERISYLADSLPEDLHDERLSPEMQEYIRSLAMTRLRLTAVLAQYDTALAPSLALLNRLEKTREEIASQLPALWKDYYLQKPVPWLSTSAWTDFSKQMT